MRSLILKVTVLRVVTDTNVYEAAMRECIPSVFACVDVTRDETIIMNKLLCVCVTHKGEETFFIQRKKNLFKNLITLC